MPVDYCQYNFGLPAVIREIHPEDIPELIEGLASLSFESRTTRFFFDKKAFSPEDLVRLTLPGDENHLTRVAVTSDGSRDAQIVGHARCVRVAEKAPIADVGVVVSDSWQRCGIGTRLTTELRNAALRVGITHWRADFFPINLGAEKLLRVIGREEQREYVGCGIVRVTLKLAPAL
jgi:GNAT superfamily N-acetyltransferase